MNLKCACRLIGILALFISANLLAQTVVPNVFQSGQPALATEVNDNFSALEQGVQDLENTRATGTCFAHGYVNAIDANGVLTCKEPGQDGNNTRYGTAALTGPSGFYNTGIGMYALQSTSSGGQNTATGYGALRLNTSGRSNTAMGFTALFYNTNGRYNTAIGEDALRDNIDGYFNISVGFEAGSLLTTGDYNIDIGNTGNPGETHTIRIGANQAAAYIAGIRDTTTGQGNAIGVVIDSNGQLGTVSSSIRYKQDIDDMGQASDRLLQLRPVSFRYKEAYENGEKPLQYGLIAEEVAEVFPELVAYNEENEPESVKYRILSSLLLNEFQKQNATLKNQEEQLAALEAQVEELGKLIGHMVKN